MRYRLIVTIGCVAMMLQGCSTNSDGTKTLGMKGSSAWHKFAPIEEKIAYFSPACLAFGFEPGTDAFASCIQREMSDDRALANERSSEISNAISQATAVPPRTSRTKRSVTCTTLGNITQCY